MRKLIALVFHYSLNGLLADRGTEYFTKHPGRFISMHVQDIDMNAPLPEPPPGGARGCRAGRQKCKIGRRVEVAAEARAAVPPCYDAVRPVRCAPGEDHERQDSRRGACRV